MRWLALLLLFPLLANAGYEMRSLGHTTIAAFQDDTAYDDAWDDGSIYVQGDGGSSGDDRPQYKSLPTTETAYLLLHAKAGSSQRVVVEYPTSSVYSFPWPYTRPAVGSTAAILSLHIDAVVGTPTIEVYAYYGDGTVEGTDASISGKTLIDEYVLPQTAFDHDRDLIQVEMDMTTFVTAALAAAEDWIGIVVRIKDDTTTPAEEYVSLWSGEIMHAETDGVVDVNGDKRNFRYHGPAIVVDCVPNCTENTVTYEPAVRAIDDYPNAPTGICTSPDMTGLPTYTLIDDQSLEDLYDIGIAASSAGFTIQIPYNTNTVQCDGLRVPINSTGFKLHIQGIPGPNGELPRFYCRRTDFGGYVSKNESEVWLEIAQNYDDYELTIDSVHLDGYTQFAGLGNGNQTTKFRSSYFHHARNNGFAHSNVAIGEVVANYQFCGNELSHSGGSNVVHGWYMHRGLYDGMDGKERKTKVYVIDSRCHSTNFSSCFKSIANENHLIGNYFSQSAVPGETTDIDYPQNQSSMLIDITSCANNTIENNTIEAFNYENNGDILIGMRNRRAELYGCDVPGYWTATEQNNASNFWNVGTINPDFFADSYWNGLGGAKTFITSVKDNTFTKGPYGFNDKMFGTTMWGTFPNESAALGLGFWLQAPDLWYERSQVQFDSNTYVGWASDKLYNQGVNPDCTNPNKGCPYEEPGLVFPAAEDTSAPYHPGAAECVSELNDIDGICDYGTTPEYLYTVIGGETIQ